MKKTTILLIFVLLTTSIQSCTEFLDVSPKGVLSEENLTSPEGIEGMVIAAYSALGSDSYRAPFSLWSYGNVRSDDAYKGGRDEADIQAKHFFETFVYVQPNMGGLEGGGDPDELWFSYYMAISRINNALRALNAISEDEMPIKKVRQAEMRFLRAHFYFNLKIMWKHVPFIDEFVPVNDYATVSNRDLTSDELWNRIAEDLEFAVNNLPAQQPEIGRANRYAAHAYLARVRLFQAYEQDDLHNVININPERLEQVVLHATEVINSPYYSLEPDFANNFLPGPYENGPESVWAIQYSVGDVAPFGRLNWGDVLSAPMAGGFGCCGFHLPSQNLVNAFKTDINGLPLLNTFNDADWDGIQSVDPRLHHTVAMVGNPWKYETDLIIDEAWLRNPVVYGYYMSLKENVSPRYEGMINIDPFFGNSKNRIVIRYADVLLMKAEALIELNRVNEALPLINEIRTRASNSASRLVDASEAPLANYNVGVYSSLGTQEEAREKLRFERRLELAMEGNRFFDLVRWGIADQVLNAYFEGEREKRSHLRVAHFTKNRDEYAPIPQQQIFWSRGTYVQNPGY